MAIRPTTNSAGKVTELRDGYLSFEGGVDMWTAPVFLPANKVAFAVNCTFRGGTIAPRPGWRKITLSFATDAFHPSADDMATAWRTGRFQGAGLYRASTRQTRVLVSISGRIFCIEDVDQGIIKELTLPNDANSATARQVIMRQMENFLAITAGDGATQNLYYSGASLIRGNATALYLPVGSGPMTYGMGRAWVARGDQWIAGDLVGNTESGTRQWGYRDSVLKQTENQYLTGGGSFSTPLQTGDITAMEFIANLDTTLGSGDLLIHTPEAVYASTLPFDRTQWAALTFPAQRIGLMGSGAAGQWAIANINGDQFFRAQDGIRSVVMARRDFATWANTPVSREVEPILTKDADELLKYGSMVGFDNRLLTTCSPVATDHGVWHDGLIALDFDPSSTLGGRLPPAYDGLWTGVRVLQVLAGTFNGQKRCLAFSLNGADQIELWELTKAERFDEGEARIPWEWESRAFTFKQPTDYKELLKGDMWISELWGKWDLTLKFRDDDFLGWVNWMTDSEEAVIQNDAPGEPVTYGPGYRQRIAFGQPPDTEDSQNMKIHRQGNDFSVRMEMLGYAEINRVRLFCNQLPEGVYGET